MPVPVGPGNKPEISWVRRTFSKLTWDELESVVDSPKEVCAVVRHNLRYEEDAGEEWPTGQETWERGYGDCEDYAACIVDLCATLGFDASILVLYPETGWEGHAIATGRWEGRLWFSSNGWYKTIKSMEEAKRDVAREMGWGMKTRVNSVSMSSLVPGDRKIGPRRRTIISP